MEETVLMFKSMVNKSDTDNKLTDQKFLKLIEYENKQSKYTRVPNFDAQRFMNFYNDFLDCEKY